MNMERLNDLLSHYGEVCDQQIAAKILSVHPRTIYRMMEEGRLRRAGRRVDVRSIAEYIENPECNFLTHTVKSRRRTTQISREEILAAARKGHWSAKEQLASDKQI